MIVSIISQLAYHLNYHNCRYQKILAMFFKSKATPALVVDLLHQLGISMSFWYIFDAVHAHSNAECESVIRFIKDSGRPMVIYDNIRIMFKETQWVNNQTHGDNGMSMTVVRLPESVSKPLHNYCSLYQTKLNQLRMNSQDGFH